MRRAIILAALIPTSLSYAAEVVWLTPAPDAVKSAVSTAAQASRPPLTGLEFRSAGSDFGPEDQAAWDRLEAVLAQVRAFETRLDGEQIIAQDLAPAIEAITLLRNDADRTKLRKALAYQGFAVSRWFGPDLATAAEAKSWRHEISGQALVKPWLDAAALDPSFAVTPYEIAEAPERVAYGESAAVVARALPASLRPQNLPEGSVLVVDGQPVTLDASGMIRVPPGRHLAHVEAAGHVLARWDLRLEPGDSVVVAPPVLESDWRKAVDELSEGETPNALRPAIRALGGEVWVARHDGISAKVFAVTPDGVTQVRITTPEEDAKEARTSNVHLGAALGLGWMWDGDFLLSNADAQAAPEGDRFGIVNAIQPELTLEVGWHKGPLAASAGVSAWLPLGANQTARTGDRDVRIRTLPHIALGTPWLMVLGGYLFPHHPLVGLRAELPFAEGRLAIRGEARLGISTSWSETSQRAEWTSQPVRSAGLSVVTKWP